MKLKYLLPVVALSGIATIATPLVSCGNNGGGGEDEKIVTMDLETSKEVMSTVYYLTTQNTFTTDLETKYVFNIDFTDYNWSGYITTPEAKEMFVITIGDFTIPMGERVRISSAEITIDGEPLSTDAEKELSADKTFFVEDNGMIGYRFDNIKKTSKLIFTIKVAESKEGANPVVCPMFPT